ncbi:MAG: type I restriction enzyme HsdR N-terminal domain-containing protein, partial [Fimbriimonadia bacterium]|nr:type I restriction enzyme HsdR N-terminal domain-containing protein [Fimbriimonadia bacterium]
MRFEAERKELLNRINRWRSWNLFNEEATILGVVLPIIKLMGYDISNPEEVLPQSPDRNRNRPDLKLYQMSALDNGEVKHVIEVKALSKNELANSTSQIGSYFVGNSAQWYVLTNGYEWKIYDSNSPHTKPRYFRINIILDTVGAIDALYHILGKDVDTPDIESAAEKIVKGRLETAARKIFWSDHRTVWEGAAQLHKSLLQDVEKLKKEFASHEDMIEQWRQDFE